jgi:phosphoglycerate kinase
MNKKTIRDIDVQGRRVLIRVDFNVPLRGGQVADDRRIRAALPTLQYLLERGASLALMSHLGRPQGQISPDLSLSPVAVCLSGLLDRRVGLLDDCVGPAVEDAVRALVPGQVVLLENLRFHQAETDNDPTFAAQLAKLGQVYVNDAFGAAHRAHASTAGVANYLRPAVAGLLMETELNYLGRVLTQPETPFLSVLGGAKISDKIGVIENLLDKVDALLIGGGMANTFFLARGLKVGQSLVETEALPTAERLLNQAGERLFLPVDVIVADEFRADAALLEVPLDEVPDGWMILDIGPATIAHFSNRLATAKTVVWNGPMGVFEFPRFAAGTVALAGVLADLTRRGATTIVGGGDSAAAVEQAGLADQISHISTGGGASLEFLEGKTLPGLAALDDR